MALHSAIASLLLVLKWYYKVVLVKANQSKQICSSKILLALVTQHFDRTLKHRYTILKNHAVVIIKILHWKIYSSTFNLLCFHMITEISCISQCKQFVNRYIICASKLEGGKL